MTEKSIDYEGYRITARPRQVEESDNWTIDITISRGEGREMEQWLVSSSDQAEINAEAFEDCFTFGKEVIDRELSGDRD